MLDWLESFQIFAAVWVIVIIGLICGVLKIFSAKDIYAIRKLVYLVPMAAMLFREIGNSKLDRTTWVSFEHAIIIQGLMHILSFIYALIYHPNDTIRMKFLKNAMSLCQTDFLYYAVPIAQVLFSPTIAVHAALACFVQYLLIVPFHEVLGLAFVDDCEQKMNTSHEPVVAPPAPIEPKEVPKPPVEEEEEDLNDVDSPEEVEVIDENGKSHIVKVQDDNLEEEQHHEYESSENKNQQNQNQNKEKEETKPAPPPDVPAPAQEVKKPKYWTLNWLFFWAFVNQLTICGVLGIIWSAINIKMPKFLDSFVTDLQKAIYAPGLFCNGIFIWNHSFKGAPVVDVIVGVISHFFIQPGLSYGVSLLLKQPDEITKFLVYSNAAPSAMYGYHLSLTFEFGESMISYILYWTTLLTLPVYLIWTAILNEIFK